MRELAFPCRLRRMQRVALLTLSLAACLVVLAYRSSADVLLALSQGVSALAALLHFAVVAMLGALIVRALAVRRDLHANGRRTAASQRLRGAIFSTLWATLILLLLAIATVGMPLVIPVVRQVPEVGLVVALMLLGMALHSVTIRRTSHRLQVSIAAARIASRRTLAA